MIRIPLLVVGLGLASAFAPQRPNAIAPQRSLSADRRVRKLAATSPSFFDKQMTEATTELSWGDAYAARRFKPLDTRASASTFPTTIEPLQSAEWGALALPRVTSVSMGELNTFTAGFMGWDQSGAATATIPAAADAQRHMLESIAGGHHDPAHLRPLPKKLAIAAPESALGGTEEPEFDAHDAVGGQESSAGCVRPGTSGTLQDPLVGLGGAPHWAKKCDLVEGTQAADRGLLKQMPS
eukprot:CAMPEP_0119543102 /NCGR_PEP_ID=MMETSP1344-20130328/53943_1 /TAXON_ID=236787 /ORGANISM="Florenciella parvula, Strain CCMP2471" /LENGTH=238 /DNA_ID=CAMNT_0007587375 /DNA_START=96 /DNA_END=811 /DNA_ORIENTATION=-